MHECYARSLPVYIFVPIDMVHELVPTESLSLPPVEKGPLTDQCSQKLALSATLSKLYRAKAPAVVVDALTTRHLGREVTRKLVDKLQFPTFSTSMGKSIIDETKPYFCGIYNGEVSLPDVCRTIEEESDLVFDLGPLHSDSNTGGHTRHLDGKRLIEVHPHHVNVAGITYRNIGLVSCKVSASISSRQTTNKIQSLVRSPGSH